MSGLELSLYKEYPPLFGTDKNGKTRVWKASVFQNTGNSTAIAIIQHGTYAGKLQVDKREYTVGKNVGKKNETSPLEQCILETEKKRRDKMEKENYNETFPGREDILTASSCAVEKQQRKIFPMLANKYEPNSATKKKQGIVYPCFVQPKLDGLRCVVYLGSDGNPVYQSRTGGIFTVLQHLDESILRLSTPGTILDGELYTSQIPFEELAGIIKKKTLSNEDREKIQAVEYHVYDVVLPNVEFQSRLTILHNILVGSSHKSLIVSVPTFLVQTPAEFKEKFGEFVEQGYEGIMLRNATGLYQENYRSNDLMKYKEFMESEYPIVNYREATGRDAGTVIWECAIPNGRCFSVRPRGTVEMRRRWFEEGSKYVGKQLTVIYQELSEMGVPRFPVGKAIREGY